MIFPKCSNFRSRTLKFEAGGKYACFAFEYTQLHIERMFQQIVKTKAIFKRTVGNDSRQPHCITARRQRLQNCALETTLGNHFQVHLYDLKPWIVSCIYSDTDGFRRMIYIYFDTKIAFSPQSIFYPLFLNEGSRTRKNRLSKLHYRFQRYASLPNFEEDHHNFAGIEIQAKVS